MYNTLCLYYVSINHHLFYAVFDFDLFRSVFVSKTLLYLFNGCFNFNEFNSFDFAPGKM